MDISNDIKDWIMLTLTNVNPLASSTVSLFKQPLANQSAIISGEAVFSFPKTEFGAPVTVNMQSSTGTLSTVINVLDIDAFILALQSFVTSNGGGTVFYIEPTTGIYNIFFYSSVLTLIDITGSIVYNAIGLNQNIITGSTVNVEVGATSLTYNELVSELNSQPYKLDFVNVYANDINQVNTSFVVNNVEMTGHLVSEEQGISLSPISKQFVQLNIPIDYTPRPTSSLEYTVGAGENLKLIFSYSHAKLIRLPKDVILVPKKELPNIEGVFRQLAGRNPLTALIEDSNLSHGGRIKKVLQKYVEPSKVDVRQVWSAFDDSDFKEL